MKRELAGGVASVLVVMSVTAGSAQQASLAEIAREEKARRDGIDERSRVYTNDDLHGGPRLTTGTSSTTAVPGDATTGETPVNREAPTPFEDPAVEPGEDEWRRRITTARSAKRRAELLASALQNRVDGLWAEFTARDDPFQRAGIEQDRIEALEELEQTQADVLRLDEEIRAIQDEARRAGVPPGWLRAGAPE